jgi:hypothetical protein
MNESLRCVERQLKVKQVIVVPDKGTELTENTEFCNFDHRNWQKNFTAGIW